jgi:hypothetical protein
VVSHTGDSAIFNGKLHSRNRWQKTASAAWEVLSDMKKSTKHLIEQWQLNANYLEVTDQQWSELEKIIRHGVPSLARALIQASATVFKIFGPASKQKVAWRRIEREITAWRKHTIKLRLNLGKKPSTDKGRLRRVSLQNRYSKFELPPDPISHLMCLDRTLELALDTTDYIAQQINRMSVETIDDEMWYNG